MKRKILCIAFALVLVLGSLAGCGSKDETASKVDPELQKIYDSLDLGFSTEVTTKIAQSGTHPELGYRLAGSSGETTAVNSLYQTFKDIGLENVTKHKTKVDTWSMTKSDLYYKDAQGEKQKMILGGYQTTFKANQQKYDLIYLSRGTADDYEKIDAKGKIVLIDINQADDWWINWPAYQAKVKGAACIIAANSGGYGQLDKDTIQAQDVCGPSDAPALSISNQNADVLKKLIKVSKSKSIEITMDCNAKVTNDGTSHNVSGVIPGKTDETIFLMGHIDGYFHAWHDDASGVGMALGIAKAILDSGYQPEKTIIVTTHGAEEWGLENSRYDWAIGAYEQIMHKTPKWADNGFTVINCESGCARDDDTHFCLGASYELKSVLEDIVLPMNDESPWKEDNEIYSPATVWSEDFAYSLAGVPGMVTRKTSGKFNLNSYHTNKDVQEDHYKEEHYEYSHKVYCSVLYALDKMPVQPLDFTTRLDDLAKSAGDACPDKEKLVSAAKTASETATQLKDQIADYNKSEISADEAKKVNDKLRNAYKFAQNKLTAFDWEDNIVFPHDCSQINIKALETSIKALKAGDIATALDDQLHQVDYNWYAYHFDYETYRFFVNQTLQASDDQLAWGKGMIRQGNEDLFKVIKSLQAKKDKKNANTSKEIAALEKALENQKSIGAKIVKQEIQDIKKLDADMKALLK